MSIADLSADTEGNTLAISDVLVRMIIFICSSLLNSLNVVFSVNLFSNDNNALSFTQTHTYMYIYGNIDRLYMGFPDWL